MKPTDSPRVADGFLLITAAVLRLEARMGGAPISDAEAVSRARALAEAFEEPAPAAASSSSSSESSDAAIADTISPQAYMGGLAARGQIVFGYRLDDKVAEGGMGVVYRGTRLSTRESVAVKLPQPKLVANAKALHVCATWMEHEARATRRVSHPAFVKIVEYLTWGPIPMLVLEWIEGETLESRLARGPLDVRASLDVAVQLAEAVDAAHREQVLHLDLKPGNVMLTRITAAGFGDLRILDHGVAVLDQRGADRAVTHEGNLVGTPLYMAPEQVVRERLDERADVYAIGGILYECLTGRAPFATATDISDLLRRKLVELPPPPSGLVRHISPTLDEVVLRALAPDRAHRYPSARAMLGAIHAEMSRATAPPAGV